MTDKTIPVPIGLARRVQEGNPLSSADHATIAALLAEHDKAEMPDCEVLVAIEEDGNAILYWQRDGEASGYRCPDGTLDSPWVPEDPENYHPLPVHRGQTITPEQHEHAAIAMHRAFWGQSSGDSWPDEASDATKDALRKRATAAIAALGLVVAS